MKVILSQTELKVDKYSCQSVTIHKKSETEYEAHLHHIKGITKVVPVLDGNGKQETHWDGTKINKTLKQKKKIKSKSFEYSGVPLKKTFWIREGEDCYTAKNEKGNYINYYEQSPTSQTKSSNEDFPNGEHNMGDKVSATPTPKDASHPSHHPNIISNLKKCPPQRFAEVSGSCGV